jgi:beta-exotoxin I transport system ATP-binding protein
MSANAVLQTIDLTKRYPARGKQPGKLALDKLNLTVHRGEIFGYLGPNGAGKTTTIRLILDLIRPSEGGVRILGMDAHRQSVEVKHRIGNLPSEVRLWEHMTGAQVIRYLGGLRPGSQISYAMQMAERLALNLNLRVGDYSTGNKRKLGIVQALMHKPPLLILDEPTMGLDPLMQQTFNELMREIRNEGRTIFLSSHVLSEVEQICDRVGVLRDGTLQAVERISDLKSIRYRWVTIYTGDTTQAAEWEHLEGVNEVQMRPGLVRVCVSGSLNAVIKQAALHDVRDLRVEEPNLEDFFMTFYGEAPKDA